MVISLVSYIYVCSKTVDLAALPCSGLWSAIVVGQVFSSLSVESARQRRWLQAQEYKVWICFINGSSRQVPPDPGSVFTDEQLLQVCKDGDVAILQKLVRGGANLEHKDQVQTLLTKWWQFEVYVYVEMVRVSIRNAEWLDPTSYSMFSWWCCSCKLRRQSLGCSEWGILVTRQRLIE